MEETKRRSAAAKRLSNVKIKSARVPVPLYAWPTPSRVSPSTFGPFLQLCRLFVPRGFRQRQDFVSQTADEKHFFFYQLCSAGAAWPQRIQTKERFILASPARSG